MYGWIDCRHDMGCLNIYKMHAIVKFGECTFSQRYFNCIPIMLNQSVIGLKVNRYICSKQNIEDVQHPHAVKKKFQSSSCHQ